MTSTTTNKTTPLKLSQYLRAQKEEGNTLYVISMQPNGVGEVRQVTEDDVPEKQTCLSRMVNLLSFLQSTPEPAIPKQQPRRSSGASLEKPKKKRNRKHNPRSRKQVTFYEQVTKEQMAKSEQGVISGIAASVQNIGRILTPMPVVGTAAAMAAKAAGVIGGVAKIFGFDKPTDQRAIQTFVQRYPDSSLGMGLTTTNVLAIDPDNHVDPLLESTGANTDDMNLAHIITRPQLVSQFEFTGPSQSGDAIFCMPVHPMYSDCGAASNDQYYAIPTYAGFIANLFRHWRGSMEYRVKIFASNFHSGRLRITWVPGVTSPAELHNSKSDFYQSAGMIVDIRGNTEVSFSIPYLMDVFMAKTSWNELVYTGETMRQMNGPIASGANWLDTYDSTVYCNNVFNGSLVFTVENELTFPSTPVPNASILIYQNCGADMQFAEPYTDSYSSGIVYPRATTDALPVINSMDVPAGAGLANGYAYAEAYKTSGATQNWSDPSTLMFTEQSDVQPDGEITDPVISTNETTTFLDLAEHSTEDVQDSSTVTPAEVMPIQEIRAFLARPLPIFRHIWSASDAAGAAFVIDPLTTYLNSPVVRRKIANYRYIKADVVVEIRINGTKFHYGAWGYSRVPLGSGVTHNPHVTMLTGFDGGVITPDTEVVHTIRFPYLWNKAYYDIKSIGTSTAWAPGAATNTPGGSKADGFDLINAGMLYSYALTPLRGGTVASADVAPINMVYFAHLENVELQGFIPENLAIPAAKNRSGETAVLCSYMGSGTVIPRMENIPMSAMFYPAFGGILPAAPEFREQSQLNCPYTLKDLIRGIKDPNVEEIVFEEQGYTNSELAQSKCIPIIPAQSLTVSERAMNGEVVSHVKQLAMRPSLVVRPGFAFNGGFLSPFVGMPLRVNQLDRYRGANTVELTTDQSGITNNNTSISQFTSASFAEVFSHIYLGKRGAVHYRDLGVTNTDSCTFNREDRVVWAERMDAVNTRSNLNSAMFWQANPPNNWGLPPTGSTGFCHRIGNTTVLEATVPYYTNVSFIYTTRHLPVTPGESLVQITPQPQSIPGLLVSKIDRNIETYPGNATANWKIVESIADDFQFVHLIPPKSVSFTVARNSNYLYQVSHAV